MDRPEGARGASSVPKSTRKKRNRTPDSRNGNTEFVFNDPFSEAPNRGPSGSRSNRGSMDITNNADAVGVPGPVTDPSSRAKTEFGRGLAGMNASIANEIRNNPGGIVNYYYDHTGRNPASGSYRNNIEYASVLSNLFDLVGGSSSVDNNAFADFIGTMLENANTPGAKSYGTNDIMNAFLGQDGPGDAMTQLEAALSSANMTGPDQVRAVNSFLNSLAQFTMSPLMASGLANLNDLRGDQFLSGNFQGMNQDSYLRQTQNDLRNLVR